MPNQSDPNQNTPVNDPVIPPVIPNPIDQGTPPSMPILDESDIPPIPAGMGAPTVPVGTTVTEIDQTSPTGSAAPTDLPPMVAGPKKKFGTGKIIATILGLFLLVGGLGAGTYLVQQNQNINEEAAALNLSGSQKSAYDKCRGDSGSEVCACRVAGICTRPDYQDDPQSPSNPIVTPPPSGGNNESSCNSGGGFWCNEVYDANNKRIPGFCTPQNKTCASTATDNGYPMLTGANYRSVFPGNSCPAGFQSASCLCGPSSNQSKVCFDRGFDGTIPGTGNQCNTPGGLCELYTNSQNSGGVTRAACGTVTSYYCKGNVDLSGGKSCDTSTGGTTTRPANFCGTIQTDTACGGFKTTTVPCKENSEQATTTTTTTPTTPPSITAQCQNIKAYSPTWALLTNTQLSALTTGSQVNFCVTGSASSGAFDKAKLTINTVVQAETTTVRPGSTDFCQLYNIPIGATTFNVTAQIHHVTLGWK